MAVGNDIRDVAPTLSSGMTAMTAMTAVCSWIQEMHQSTLQAQSEGNALLRELLTEIRGRHEAAVSVPIEPQSEQQFEKPPKLTKQQRAILLLDKHSGNFEKIAEEINVHPSTLYRNKPWERFRKMAELYSSKSELAESCVGKGIITSQGVDGVTHVDWEATLDQMGLKAIE